MPDLPPKFEYRGTQEAGPVIFPMGLGYKLCLRDCSEAVKHRDGVRFCRLYDARLSQMSRPLPWCKVKRGLLVPRDWTETETNGAKKEVIL
jgi:hypothetical protein